MKDATPTDKGWQIAGGDPAARRIIAAMVDADPKFPSLYEVSRSLLLYGCWPPPQIESPSGWVGA